MKRILYVISLLCFKQAIAQTYVTIPDTAFAACLRAYLPSAMSGNQLDTSNILVKKDTLIYATGLGIVNLQGIQYFHSLKVLKCGGNQLTNLPPLPDSITSLECGGNKLTMLPSLPNTITYIDCSLNQLSTLPALPASLQILYCQQNQLTILPALPNSLKTLWCNDNVVLTALPTLPISLKDLACSNNQLTTLPSLPVGLQSLDCHKNNITCFPPFPTTIGSIFIFNNPFTCLPNYLPVMTTATTLFGQPLLSYPLCGLDNANGCPVSTEVPTNIIIPNIFTPNGDSVNDTFFVKGANLTNFTCKIYDRWGSLLYQWTDINAGWNGTTKSGAASDGTYYYAISYTDNTGKTNNKNGFFQLLR